MKGIILEACVDTFSDALIAAQQGANRIELCSDLAQDGLTTSVALTQKVLKSLTIPIHVMIRIRAGDFHYTPNELALMIDLVHQYKALGVQGIVFGALQKDLTIDVDSTQQIANAADGIAVVFHKAIDLTPDPVAAAKTLIKIKGVSHILTSGGAPTAKIGAEILRKMGSASSHLTIIAAGKINQRNFMEIHE